VSEAPITITIPLSLLSLSKSSAQLGEILMLLVIFSFSPLSAFVEDHGLYPWINAKRIPSEVLTPARHRSGGKEGYLIASAPRLPKSCTADRDFALPDPSERHPPERRCRAGCPGGQMAGGRTIGTTGFARVAPYWFISLHIYFKS
jgi:hypothetical protein